jgi:CheY-like chemotaxis protein
MEILMHFVSAVVTMMLAVSWFLLILAPLLLGLFVFLVMPIFVLMFASQKVLAVREMAVNVLVVDDQPSSLIVLEYILKDLKVNFRTVTSGWDAIREMNKSVFDLVIVDHDMPLMSGPETILLAERYRDMNGQRQVLANYRGVPVVGFSTRSEESWGLPKMDRFEMKGSLSKMSVYGDLRRQVEGLL